MTDHLPQLPAERLPRHIAVIMDGNGRWARSRNKPRPVGHRAGVRAARKAIRACREKGIEVLTLFAFSQENWQRPETEVKLLMQLFIRTLTREAANLHKNNIRLRFIGDHGDFPSELQAEIARSEQLTAGNSAHTLVIAVGYGGHWDIAQAAQRVAGRGETITQERLESALSTVGLPHPDLLIRTGGEKRISNFLLWQLAYTELYFCDTLWPDFGEEELEQALTWYASRERRFGRVPEAA